VVREGRRCRIGIAKNRRKQYAHLPRRVPDRIQQVVREAFKRARTETDRAKQSLDFESLAEMAPKTSRVRAGRIYFESAGSF